jgi:hypothetical protein
VLPLEEAREGFARMEAGELVGKIVLKPPVTPAPGRAQRCGRPIQSCQPPCSTSQAISP